MNTEQRFHGRVMLDCGGPEFVISVQGNRIRFEMHPYCGPCALKKNGDPMDADKQPKGFLEAASLWARQGQKVENGLCVWFHESEAAPILKHMGGRNYKVIGWNEPPPPVRGS
jgi:hypothetical protein